jgi:hypothetical protein
MAFLSCVWPRTARPFDVRMSNGPRAGIKTEQGTPTPLRLWGYALLTPSLIRPVPFSRTRPRIVRGQTQERNTLMTNTTKTGQKPTHEIFAVKDGTEGKSCWTKIGAAWPHKDGKGFSLKFDSYPPDGQSIQLRLAKPTSN